VSFSIPHPPGIPWVPEVDSPEGIRTFFELLGTHVQPKVLDLHQVISDGSEVVLIGRMGLRGKEVRPRQRHRLRLHTTVHDGRITGYHLYEDTYAVAKAYFEG
jgi:ketosteroid isomerase-like protein